VGVNEKGAKIYFVPSGATFTEESVSVDSQSEQRLALFIAKEISNEA